MIKKDYYNYIKKSSKKNLFAKKIINDISIKDPSKKLKILYEHLKKIEKVEKDEKKQNKNKNKKK